MNEDRTVEILQASARYNFSLLKINSNEKTIDL